MNVIIHDNDEVLECPKRYMSCRCYEKGKHTDHVCRCRGSWREVGEGQEWKVPEHSRDLRDMVEILMYPQGLTYEEAVEQATAMKVSAFAMILGPFDEDED